MKRETQQCQFHNNQFPVLSTYKQSKALAVRCAATASASRPRCRSARANNRPATMPASQQRPCSRPNRTRRDNERHHGHAAQGELLKVALHQPPRQVAAKGEFLGQGNGEDRPRQAEHQPERGPGRPRLGPGLGRPGGSQQVTRSRISVGKSGSSASATSPKWLRSSWCAPTLFGQLQRGLPPTWGRPDVFENEWCGLFGLGLQPGTDHNRRLWESFTCGQLQGLNILPIFPESSDWSQEIAKIHIPIHGTE